MSFIRSAGLSTSRTRGAPGRDRGEVQGQHADTKSFVRSITRSSDFIENLEEYRLSAPQRIQPHRDRLITMEIRNRRAEALCGKGQPEWLNVLLGMAPWKVHYDHIPAGQVSKDAVSLVAKESAHQTGRFDIAHLINTLTAKAGLKNWDIQTQVMSLQDGGIISTKEIKTFIEQQTSMALTGSWADPDQEAYSLLAPASWCNPLDQVYARDNLTYWVMRMTDLCYLLIQHFHEDTTNEKLESKMKELAPPDWSIPTSINRLFATMA